MAGQSRETTGANAAVTCPEGRETQDLEPPFLRKRLRHPAWEGPPSLGAGGATVKFGDVWIRFALTPAVRGPAAAAGLARGPVGTLPRAAMRIAIASDHAGFALKSHLAAALAAEGHDVVDLGPDGPDSVDYPRYAAPAAELVAGGEAERGVLVCGSGNGVAIVANKVNGIRAVNAHDADEAEMSRRHNDANVVTLSGARLREEQADAIVAAFLSTDFDGGRHARRVDQITAMETPA